MAELDVIEEPEVEEVEQAEETEQDVSEGAPEDDGLVVEVGEEVEDEPEHITELRKRYREQQKRLKELEAQTVAPKVQALPPKPTLEECDYDTAAFEQKLEGWYDQKREHDARETEAKTLAEKANERWQMKVAAYDEGKEKLGAKDFDEAEATVHEILSTPFPGIMAEDVRFGIIKQGAKDPATLVYALGKNPAKAKELAAIDDPVEFAFALGELNGKMKVVRGKAPPPERRISAGAPGVAGAVDNTLERLREEAARSGDFSKVTAYKRQKRA
jgi:hypothetical protein